MYKQRRQTDGAKIVDGLQGKFWHVEGSGFLAHFHLWNALDGEAVSSSSINAFKNRLNKIRMTRMGYFMD